MFNLIGVFNTGSDYGELFATLHETPFLERELPHPVLPLHFSNRFNDHNNDVEIATGWRPVENWRRQLSYSYSWSRPKERQWSLLNQISLHSAWDIQDDLELNAWRPYTGKRGPVPALSLLDTVSIDPHFNLTLRLGGQPRPDLEWSLTGANLLDNQYLKFIQEVTCLVKIEHSLYGQMKWSF
ncbi:MAG TPA: hypothetical protein P5149_12225 [Candidatus Competibacteraceae bacterium]|nr:hypothetical protein [Candidatus Competibacteraceae bacterium]MCP5132539.1 hypothetical protein [Gammaproteobacteria bacterium]HRY19157.1 hypothetical protein [Candidatus Competibacteraceae bacterium]